MGRIRFLLDEHIPQAVGRELRRRGVDVLSAADAGLLGAQDYEYVRRARRESRIIVTFDDDFLQPHHQSSDHAGIAYSARGRLSIGRIVEALLLIYEVYDEDELTGRVEYF